MPMHGRPIRPKQRHREMILQSSWESWGFKKLWIGHHQLYLSKEVIVLMPKSIYQFFYTRCSHSLIQSQANLSLTRPLGRVGTAKRFSSVSEKRGSSLSLIGIGILYGMFQKFP